MKIADQVMMLSFSHIPDRQESEDMSEMEAQDELQGSWVIEIVESGKKLFAALALN